MINFLPIYKETFVNPYHAEEVKRKLWHAVMPVDPDTEYPDIPEENFLFNGWVGNHGFKISKKVDQPENFLPILGGKVDETSVGSIIFITYTMFFSTNIFLIFWTIVSVLISLLFLLSYHIYEYAIIAFLLGLGNYTVAIVNFNMQVKRSRTLFHSIFSA